MATLEWIGKKAVVNHHRQVPFHLLRCDERLSVGDPGSGNLLVEGDNLVALKALLPYYAGRVKFIYIDPPYNTGNTEDLGGWRYNDDVASPEMKRWLGETVGKEAEDLTRHDKWLCMMYPRLVLLRELLREDGLIFISIDDNEASYLKCLLDEIFGPQNFQQQLVWKNKYGPGARTKGFGNVHEYVFCYSKREIASIHAPLSHEEQKKYKQRDEKYVVRGGFLTQPLMTRSKDDRPNLVYPIYYRGDEIWPEKQWIWERARLERAIANDEVVFRKTGDKWSVRFKQYLRDEQGRMRLGKPISIMIGPYNQDGTKELRGIFGGVPFNNPKPRALVEYLFSMIVNEVDEADFTVLDSFVGSGTSAHAVLSLNARDQGKRRFIGVEMDAGTCREVTVPRLTAAIKGYMPKIIDMPAFPGLGGGFRYCTLSHRLFDATGHIDADVTFSELAAHVFFTETGEPIPKEPKRKGPSALLGVANGVAVYLLFNGILGDKRVNGGNVLTSKVLAALPAHDGPKVIYGEACRMGAARLKREGIVFKQIPYEVQVS